MATYYGRRSFSMACSQCYSHWSVRISADAYAEHLAETVRRKEEQRQSGVQYSISVADPARHRDDPVGHKHTRGLQSGIPAQVIDAPVGACSLPVMVANLGPQLPRPNAEPMYT